jgi:hypothetical protein
VPFSPRKSETWVSALSEDGILNALKNELMRSAGSAVEGRPKLHGEIRETDFLLYPVEKKADNFSIRVSGRVEQMPQGSLVYLNYELVPAANRLLLFASSLTLFISLFFALVHQAWLYAAISASLGIVNYWLTRANFLTRTKKFERLLEKITGGHFRHPDQD